MKVVCTHCGLPFTAARPEPGRAAFCCSGCALAFRLAAGPGEGPPTRVVFAAIGLAFLFFNQVVAALLAGLSPAATGFGVGSLALGFLAWGMTILFQREASVRRGSDRWAAFLALATLVCAAATFRPAPAAVATALLTAWSLRGLARGKPR